MTPLEPLTQIRRLFLDTAPIIYYVEENERYLPLVSIIFERIDEGTLTAVTSPITLAECMVFPCRLGRADLATAFNEVILRGHNTIFVPIDGGVADRPASLRARYDLSLADAFQVAVAVAAECDAFLTNDRRLKRVEELDMLVLDELRRP